MSNAICKVQETNTTRLVNGRNEYSLVGTTQFTEDLLCSGQEMVSLQLVMEMQKNDHQGFDQESTDNTRSIKIITMHVLH